VTFTDHAQKPPITGAEPPITRSVTPLREAIAPIVEACRPQGYEQHYEAIVAALKCPGSHWFADCMYTKQKSDPEPCPTCRALKWVLANPPGDIKPIDEHTDMFADEWCDRSTEVKP
jgi:hypothetical protein